MGKTVKDSGRPQRTPPHVGLADLRKALGLTQDVVCQRVAARTDETFTKGALSLIENGHRGPSPETVAALEGALGLTAGALVLNFEPTHTRRLRVAEDEASA